MTHIFISYSKKNKQYANALADFLQERGFNIWIDRIGIEYGVDWWDAIVEGLEGCGAFLVVMTPESKASDWVKREVFLAMDWKKPIFPLLLNGKNWPLFVTTQYADVSSGAMPDGDLLDRLSEYVTPQKHAGENKSNLTPEKQAQSPLPKAFDIDRTIAEFGKVFRAKNWAQAMELLGRIRASGEDPTPFDPDEFEKKVQTAVEAENREREQAAFEAERQRQYGRVLAMADYADAETVWAALQKFWKNFPDYDPQKLADQVRPTPTPAPPRRQGGEQRDPIREILPDPFEWVKIPGGKVVLKENMGTHTIPDFYIAKYPITNAQFEKFIKAGGYKNKQWWTAAGWQGREKEGWTAPRYWGDQQWNGAEQPVVGVSWYEAVAFCQWLSEASSERISLPTEQQWQRAAQGDDGRIYPWGNEWDCQKCNNSVQPCESNQTTPVRQYEGKGNSPFGVVDMAGNVWEWCLTAYDTGSDDINSAGVRVLRGGLWFGNGTDGFRVDYRIRDNPYVRYDSWGFRASRSY